MMNAPNPPPPPHVESHRIASPGVGGGNGIVSRVKVGAKKRKKERSIRDAFPRGQRHCSKSSPVFSSSPRRHRRRPCEDCVRPKKNIFPSSTIRPFRFRISIFVEWSVILILWDLSHLHPPPPVCFNLAQRRTTIHSSCACLGKLCAAPWTARGRTPTPSRRRHRLLLFKAMNPGQLFFKERCSFVPTLQLISVPPTGGCLLYPAISA